MYSQMIFEYLNSEDHVGGSFWCKDVRINQTCSQRSSRKKSKWLSYVIYLTQLFQSSNTFQFLQITFANCVECPISVFTEKYSSTLVLFIQAFFVLTNRLKYHNDFVDHFLPQPNWRWYSGWYFSRDIPNPIWISFIDRSQYCLW